MSKFVKGLQSLSGLRILTPEQSDFLYDAADRIEALEAALHKIDDITIDHTAMGIARKALASAALAPERD